MNLHAPCRIRICNHGGRIGTDMYWQGAYEEKKLLQKLGGDTPFLFKDVEATEGF